VEQYLNAHGLNTFTTSGVPTGGLRPLRDPAQRADGEDD
jgi:hypothetical protein